MHWLTIDTADGETADRTTAEDGVGATTKPEATATHRASTRVRIIWPTTSWVPRQFQVLLRSTSEKGQDTFYEVNNNHLHVPPASNTFANDEERTPQSVTKTLTLGERC